MDSIRASEAPDPGSIPGEATIKYKAPLQNAGAFLCISDFDSINNL